MFEQILSFEPPRCDFVWISTDDHRKVSAPAPKEEEVSPADTDEKRLVSIRA